MRTLLIDDIRNLPADVIARNFFDGMKALRELGPWDVLLLDHDLASYREDGVEQTGYHILLWLEENREMHPEWIPKEIKLVTDNPVGRQKMLQAIESIYKERKNDATTNRYSPNLG